MWEKVVIFILFFYVNFILQISSNDSVLVLGRDKGKKWWRSWTTLLLFSAFTVSHSLIELINSVSALFINSVQKEEILFKYHSIYKGWKYIFYFFFMMWRQRIKVPTAVLLPIFFLDIKNDKYVVCPIDLTKGKQENRYVNISTFPSKLWLGHVWILPLDKASY